MTATFEIPPQSKIDALPVMHVRRGTGLCADARAAEWFGGSIRIGDRLTDSQAAKMSAEAAWRVDNPLDFDGAAYLVYDAGGWSVNVHDVDPLTPWLDADHFHVSAVSADDNLETLTSGSMRDEIASALAAGEPVEFGFATPPPSNQRVEIVFFPEINRGAICDTGDPAWSDATDWRDLVDRHNGVKPWSH